MQVFIDPGCNCSILKDGIPQNEFTSTKLRSGPIGLDVATGITVNASAEWGICLPLEDGTYQAVRGLTVKKVTSDMPKFMLRNTFQKLKAEHSELSDLNIQIPKELGGEIDVILGIKYNMLHPTVLFTMPNGLCIYKSKLLPANPGELACIGGPLESLDSIVATAGAKATIKYFGHLIRNISAGNHPGLSFSRVLNQR